MIRFVLTILMVLPLVWTSVKDAQAETNSDNTKVSTIHLTKEMFLKKVYDYESNPQAWTYEGDKPAIVDFYADWCGPCRKLAPILEEIAKEYDGNIIVYKVNTEKERELAQVFQIKSIPSLLFIPVKGKPSLAQGALPKQSFYEAIESIFGIKKPE